MNDEQTEDAGFLPEDYKFTADLLRGYIQDNKDAFVRAVCSNNLSIILAALDAAAKTP